MEEEDAQRLSDLEYSLIILTNGFLRWVARCAEASGEGNLAASDILVLHAVNHRARNKKLAEVCLVLNIEDSHTVAYSLKKLEERGLVGHEQVGRDRVYCSTEDGDAVCSSYRDIRRDSLLSILNADEIDFNAMPQISAQMNRLSRLYAEAERKATVISSERLLVK